MQRLEDLKKQLIELEKQHEKGKPLVNLVDNMVKLGSLYRNGTPKSGLMGSSSTQTLSGVPVRERLEFNYKVQEQRLLAEERRDWDRFSPDYGQLQAKVQQLYRLDQEMQEESHTLQNLQIDKELVERALAGIRLKLATSQIPPSLRDTHRKQQRLLERELSRVRLLLAHNSKKLEETVAENARLEQELVILRQKLQTSRQESFSSPPLGMVDADYPLTPEDPQNPTAQLEAELKRVQLIMGDLHRQRQEISVAVKQLTEKSDPVRPGPTGVAGHNIDNVGAGPIPGKKRQQSSWLETDLDSLVSKETGNGSQPTSPVSTTGRTPSTTSTIPLYVNTGLEKGQAEASGIGEEALSLLTPNEARATSLSQIELSEADDRMKRFYGIIPKEKQQEFKTVRIVKRESERRQRDRDRSGNIGIPLFAPNGKRRSQQANLGQLLETEERSSTLTPISNHIETLGITATSSTSSSLGSSELASSNVSSSMTSSITNTTTAMASSSNFMSNSWAQETSSSQALDEAMAQLDDELEINGGSVFQRSLSLPRGFGKTNSQGIEVEAVSSVGPFSTSSKKSNGCISSRK
ncbi:hypothetical protein FOCC_FOCC016543 [Frankliniella occidentalis]|nr:hypothetical protein FOCC_FOCC016543 [Frankliniella occidentalis]